MEDGRVMMEYSLDLDYIILLAHLCIISQSGNSYKKKNSMWNLYVLRFECRTMASAKA